MKQFRTVKSFETIRPIGGYFEWEFPPQKDFTLHKNAVLLNSGRHALEYILRGIGNVSRLFIPYYTCDAVLVPLKRLDVPYSFYTINERLEIKDDIQLQEGEYLLYTNYFGIKDKYVAKVAKQYGDKVIIDNAQALYCPAYAKHQIYSPRKYMGMPDGGIAVTTVPDASSTLQQGLSYDRCTHLLKRTELLPSEGYMDFKGVSHIIAESPLSRMSEISKNILMSVDLDLIKEQRRRNFQHLNQFLAHKNKLLDSLTLSLSDFECPMVYPYLTSDKDLKDRLIKEQVFVATYWPNVLDSAKPDMLEYEFASNLIAIPLDQRCDEEDMNRIIEIINR